MDELWVPAKPFWMTRISIRARPDFAQTQSFVISEASALFLNAYAGFFQHSCIRTSPDGRPVLSYGPTGASGLASHARERVLTFQTAIFEGNKFPPET